MNIDRNPSDPSNGQDDLLIKQNEAKQVLHPRSLRSSSLSNKQKLIIIVAVASCLTTASLILTARPNQREFFQNWTIELTSGVAACIAIFLYLGGTGLSNSKTRLDGLILMLGIVSWFGAESIWNFYVYGLGVEIPFPSAADILYLAGYPCLTYYLYRINKSKSYAEKDDDSGKFIGTAVVITAVAFVLNLFLLHILESSIGFSEISQTELMTLVLSLAYPILDAILIVPSIIILQVSLRKHSGAKAAGGIILACAMLSMAIGDTGFGYDAVGQIEELTTQGTWDILFGCTYILLSGYMLLTRTEIRPPALVKKIPTK